jgi:hypothetical protein
MNNNGKSLERVIKLIQETLKDSPNTKVYNNYKIENSSGRKREIDILIVSSVNDFEIKIAIECKDYSKKVPVKEIEAFQTKCDRIKGINTKVFVSTLGYQKDAINTAEYYGIILHTANELTESEIKQWLPIKQLRLEILSVFNSPTMFFDTTDDELIEIVKYYDGIVYRENTDDPIHISTILSESVHNNKRIISNLALLEWMKLDDLKQLEPFPVKFNLSFNDYFIKTKKGEKIKLFNLESSVFVKYHQESANIISSRNLKDSKNNNIATSITVDIGQNLKSDIIIDKY